MTKRFLSALTILLAATSVPAQQVIAGPSVNVATAQQFDHISVATVGSGTAVFLIPGLASPRAVWDGVTPMLAKSHKVYRVQVNGFGGDDPHRNLKAGLLDGIVDDIDRLIQRDHLKNVAVVGHSMGGLIGLMLAIRHPHDIDRLMVVDSLPFFAVLMAPPGSSVTPAMVAPQAAAMRDGMIARYGKSADPAAIERQIGGMTLKPDNLVLLRKWAAAADPRVTAQALYEDLTTDVRVDLPKISVPVTVVYAWNGKTLPKVRALPFFRTQYAGLKGVEIVDAGEAAHFVMLDQPDNFAHLLNGFVNKMTGQPRRP